MNYTYSTSFRRLLAILVLIVPAHLSAQPTEVPTDAQVQVINGATSADAADVDIYSSESMLAGGISSHTATPFMEVAAGLHNIRVMVDHESLPIYEAEVALEEGVRYQIIFTDVNWSNPDEAEKRLHMIVRESPAISELDPNAVLFAVVNGNPFSQTLEMEILEGDGGSTEARFTDCNALAVCLEQKLWEGDYLVDATSYNGDGSVVPTSFKGPFSRFGGEQLTLVAVVAPVFDLPGSNSEDVVPDYAILSVDQNGKAELLVAVSQLGSIGEKTESIVLRGNYPNPFNPSTNVSFDLSTGADVFVTVYDLTGRRVMITPPQYVEAGLAHQIQLDASALASGSYVYQVIGTSHNGAVSGTGRMLLLK